MSDSFGECYISYKGLVFLLTAWIKKERKKERRIIREGASHSLSLCRDGTRFFCFGGFDTPETHIRHVQNLFLIAEMESAS